MNRPNRFSEDIIAKIADALLPKVLRWMDEPEANESAVRKDLLDILDTHNIDGYQLARELDYLGWSVDAELVTILDEVSFILYNTVSQAEKVWVLANSIKPEFSVGDKVQRSGYKDVGTITSIAEDKGYYGIRFADGKEYLVVYENVRAAEPQ